MNLVPNNQLLLNVPFQSTKYRRKEFWVDNKVQETIGNVYCPTCRIEKYVFFSSNKTTSFYDVESAKPAATFLICLSKTKNRQLRCLAVMVHIVSQ